MPRFTIEYLGRENPCQDRDAVAVRLRVLRDERYFQFVKPIIDRPTITQRGELGAEWWQLFAGAGAAAVELEIRRGLQPMREPSQAMLLPLSSAQVDAATPASELNPAEHYLVGPVISEFEIDD